ncbi:MAG: YIP1 family protein [Deltaproteobacteria bacterium]|nr:YIP1 family protein [Deltaproteobacteria bacterium]
MSGLKTALLTFWAPGRALAQAADERRFFWPLLLCTMVMLGFAALTVTRADYVRLAETALEKTPEETAKLTPHEREEKIATVCKVAIVGEFASALLWPTTSVLLAALCLWLGFKVAGGAPGFVGTFAVLAHAMLPSALHELLSVPALLTRSAIRVGEASQLLPSSLAALAPEGLPLPKLALLGSVELFALWSVALVVLGMAHLAQVSRLRSAVVVTVLWASFVLVFRFALPTLGGAGSS